MAWDEDDEELPKLPPQQYLFVQEYLKEMNGRKAALAAGSKNQASADVFASRLLSNVKVQAHVAAALKAKRLRNEIDADWFVKRLVKIVDFDPAQAVEIDGDGTIKLKKDAPRGSLRYFDTISTSSSESHGESDSESRSVSIKNKDKLKAMELLSKVLGLNNGNGKPDGSDRQAVDRRLSESLRKHSKSK